MLSFFNLHKYTTEHYPVNIGVDETIIVNHCLINGQYEGYRKMYQNGTYQIFVPTRYRYWKNLVLILTIQIRKNIIRVSSSDIIAVFKKDGQKIGTLKYYSFGKDDIYISYNFVKNKATQTHFKYVNAYNYKYQRSTRYINNAINQTRLVSFGRFKGKVQLNRLIDIILYYKDNKISKIKTVNNNIQVKNFIPIESYFY